MKVLQSDVNVELLLAAAIAAEHSGDMDLAENLLGRAIATVGGRQSDWVVSRG